MKGAIIFVEGGGNGADTQSRCREGFRSLLENCGYTGAMPRIFACGSRREAYERFKTAHLNAKGNYVALLIDSEDHTTEIESTWEHLAGRKDDSMPRPVNATDEQIFLMTTSMETWIAAAPAALAGRYGDKFQASALPSKQNIETRHRNDVLGDLIHATRNCKTNYEKVKHSFDLLGRLNPCALYEKLPSFQRMIRILDRQLDCKHTPGPNENDEASADDNPTTTGV